MAKATTIKDALKRWEDKTKENSADATVIELQFQWPPIEKMDNALSALVNCEYVQYSAATLQIVLIIIITDV